MRITHLFSGIPTADFEAALGWYERLLGRSPDNRPHESEAVWQLSESALIYVVLDPGRAGQALLTLIVGDLGAQIDELRLRGIEVGPIETLSAGPRRAAITDPDGNRITIAEV